MAGNENKRFCLLFLFSFFAESKLVEGNIRGTSRPDDGRTVSEIQEEGGDVCIWNDYDWGWKHLIQEITEPI